MPNPGIGFATGLLQGLTRNVEEDEKQRQLRATLQGDILGLGGEVSSPDGGTTGVLPGLASAFGLAPTPGPSVESLLVQKGMLAGQQQNFQKALEVIKSGAELDPQQEAQLLSTVPGGFSRMLLTGVLKKQKAERDMRAELERLVQDPNATPEQKRNAALNFFFRTGKAAPEHLTGTKPPERPVVVNTPAGGRSTIIDPTTGQERVIEGPPRPERPRSPRDIAFERLTPEEQRQALTGETRDRARREMFVFQNLGSYVNKRTGQKASELATVPNLEEIERDFIKLSPDQLKNIDALRGLDNQISEYTKIIEKLGLPEPGLGVITSGLDIKRRRLLGDPDVRRLDAIRAEITQLARAFGGDSRVSDKEMQILSNAVVKDFDSKTGATEAINVLRAFRNNRARAIGIPGLLTSGEPEERKTINGRNYVKRGGQWYEE